MKGGASRWRTPSVAMACWSLQMHFQKRLAEKSWKPAGRLKGRCSTITPN